MKRFEVPLAGVEGDLVQTAFFDIRREPASREIRDGQPR